MGFPAAKYTTSYFYVHFVYFHRNIILTEKANLHTGVSLTWFGRGLKLSVVT